MHFLAASKWTLQLSCVRCL